MAVPQDLVPKEKASKSTEQTKTEGKPTTSIPSEGIHAGYSVSATRMNYELMSINHVSALCLSAKIKQFLKDSLSSQNSTFTLAHMASLEKKLIKHFQVKSFLSLEQGNFLEFLVKHVQVQVFPITCLYERVLYKVFYSP